MTTLSSWRGPGAVPGAEQGHSVIIFSRRYHDGESPKYYAARYMDGPASCPRTVSMGDVHSGWDALFLALACEQLFKTTVVSVVFETVACSEVECDHCRPVYPDRKKPIRTYIHKEQRR